jgi:predicted nucleic acid-binding protein
MDCVIEYIVKNHTLVLSDLVIDEFVEVAAYDRFQKVTAAKEFLKKLNFTEYQTPEVTKLRGVSIRDANDYDILFSAIRSEVDIFLTGDKDFLECGVSKPRMMTITGFETEFMK